MSLPRVSSRTPLTTVVATTQDKEPVMSLTPHLAAIVAAVHPRKSKQRTTFIALLILMCLSTYIFIAHSAQLSPALSLRHSDHSPEQLAAALESMQQAHVSNKHRLKKSHHHLSSNKAQSIGLQMSREQELAAVTSFLASLPQNVIPENVDPSKPIDPQLVLDFDTRGPRAQEEVKAIMEEVWLRNPVFLYSKMYSSQSREVKTILNSLALRPAPTVIDVDTRDDAEILTPMLARLTAVPELPTLIIGGKPVGSVEEVKALHKSGQLQKMITEAGALINGAKRKKGRK